MSHGSGADEPCGQYEPRLQLLHAVLPEVAWKKPPSQSVHSAAAYSLATVPRGHFAGAVDARAHALPGGHSEHCSAAARSVRLLYRPFGHGWLAAAPSLHVEPASQLMQAVAFCSGWKLPPGHGVHSVVRPPRS